MKTHGHESQNQGEGNREAARHYNEQAEQHAKSGKSKQAARDAEPRDEQEREEMRQAEKEGRSHAKGKRDTQS